jgi:hypothetical protein
LKGGPSQCTAACWNSQIHLTETAALWIQEKGTGDEDTEIWF